MFAAFNFHVEPYITAVQLQTGTQNLMNSGKIELTLTKKKKFNTQPILHL